VNKLTTSMLIT